MDLVSCQGMLVRRGAWRGERGLVLCGAQDGFLEDLEVLELSVRPAVCYT